MYLARESSIQAGDVRGISVVQGIVVSAAVLVLLLILLCFVPHPQEQQLLGMGSLFPGIPDPRGPGSQTPDPRSGVWGPPPKWGTPFWKGNPMIQSKLNVNQALRMGPKRGLFGAQIPPFEGPYG